ncbi:alpha/beta fold hydrolase [Nocardia puris]|uniref:alpha/beta fold hydrolase n=1 Tax=Nocardia puris TaxID=208602 RepID=UPI00189547C1|nr:alpha/beta fold hydrolase [Nocardia puris]MBF6210431.1 alpha/beta fold hydrolase [Nocardia puris]MBF6367506.1 alpha/beta fold hydrolase [Nocardia puris]MBF6457691.1 alpha/beta fold hydrolase [Nocardia puris]
MTDSSDTTDSAGARRPVRSRRVAGPGGDLAVYEWGEPAAPPFVLVHGLTDTHRAWAEVAVLLADGFRVIAYDVRGHGGSRVRATADLRLESLADDLFTVLDAVSPHTPAHICGHGWGATQVWEALSDPRANTRIASFTAISGPNLDHLGAQLRELALRPRLLARLVTDRKFLRHSAESVRTAAGRVVYPPRVRTLLIERLGGIAPARAACAPTWRRDLRTGARIAAANLPRRLLRPRPRTTAVPVQLLVDTTDVLVPPFLYYGSGRWVDRLWRCAVPGDHWLPVTEPLLVAEALANFAEDLAATDPSIPRG